MIGRPSPGASGTGFAPGAFNSFSVFLFRPLFSRFSSSLNEVSVCRYFKETVICDSLLWLVKEEVNRAIEKVLPKSRHPGHFRGVQPPGELRVSPFVCCCFVSRRLRIVMRA